MAVLYANSKYKVLSASVSSKFDLNASAEPNAKSSMLISEKIAKWKSAVCKGTQSKIDCKGLTAEMSSPVSVREKPLANSITQIPRTKL